MSKALIDRGGARYLLDAYLYWTIRIVIVHNAKIVESGEELTAGIRGGVGLLLPV